MGSPNPKYQLFHGLWAIKIVYDHEVEADFVRWVCEITSPTMYWSCDMDRDVDIHPNEFCAREAQRRVMAAYHAAKDEKTSESRRQAWKVAKRLVALYGARAWWNIRNDSDLLTLGAHVHGCTEGSIEDEEFIRSLMEESS